MGPIDEQEAKVTIRYHIELWKQKRFDFYLNQLGISKSSLQFHQHDESELAHYAKDAYDIQYQFPFGWGEIEGIHRSPTLFSSFW